MSTNPLNFRLPSPITQEMAHPEVVKAINNNTNQGFDNLSAIVALKTQVEALKTATTAASTSSTSSGSSSSTITSSFAGQGTLNNQTGNNAYATQSSDNGALVVVSDASPVAISLNSTATTPFYCFFTNIGTGTATLTPTNGAVINGISSFTLLPNYTSLVVLSAGAWWATATPLVPATFNAVAHEWINSYNAATGSFTATRPGFTDLTGTASTTQIGTGTPAAGKYVDGASGVWTALPAGMSVTVTTAALTVGGTQGSQTFVDGRLTAQVQAT